MFFDDELEGDEELMGEDLGDEGDLEAGDVAEEADAETEA